MSKLQPILLDILRESCLDDCVGLLSPMPCLPDKILRRVCALVAPLLTFRDLR